MLTGLCFFPDKQKRKEDRLKWQTSPPLHLLGQNGHKVTDSCGKLRNVVQQCVQEETRRRPGGDPDDSSELIAPLISPASSPMP